MALGSCNPSGRGAEVLVHGSEDVNTDLLEFSFHFRDVHLRVRRLPLVVLFQLGIPQLQFPLRSLLGVLLLSRQPSILVLLLCVGDFQHPFLSSSAHLLSSRHCSPRASPPAVNTALSVLLILYCCWVCSFRLLLAVLFCLLLAMLFCHFVQLSEILVDLYSSSSKFFASVLLFDILVLPLALTSFHHWQLWL